MVDCTWLAWHGIFWDFVWDIERSPRSLRSVSTRHNWEGSRIEHLVSLWLPLLGEYPSFDKHGWNSQLVFLSFPSWELNFTAPGSNGLPSLKTSMNKHYMLTLTICYPGYVLSRTLPPFPALDSYSHLTRSLASGPLRHTRRPLEPKAAPPLSLFALGTILRVFLCRQCFLN
jgi:hypothetical protein